VGVLAGSVRARPEQAISAGLFAAQSPLPSPPAAPLCSHGPATHGTRQSPLAVRGVPSTAHASACSFVCGPLGCDCHAACLELFLDSVAKRPPIRAPIACAESCPRSAAQAQRCQRQATILDAIGRRCCAVHAHRKQQVGPRREQLDNRGHYVCEARASGIAVAVCSSFRLGPSARLLGRADLLPLSPAPGAVAEALCVACSPPSVSRQRFAARRIRRGRGVACAARGLSLEFGPHGTCCSRCASASGKPEGATRLAGDAASATGVALPLWQRRRCYCVEGGASITSGKLDPCFYIFSLASNLLLRTRVGRPKRFPIAFCVVCGQATPGEPSARDGGRVAAKRKALRSLSLRVRQIRGMPVRVAFSTWLAANIPVVCPSFAWAADRTTAAVPRVASSCR
jgi:hypothetical protein